MTRNDERKPEPKPEPPMPNPLNPLDTLAREGTLPQLPPPPAPKVRTGRRETRLAVLGRARKVYATTQTTAEGKTLPVRRAERKRPEGFSARQWKKQQRAERRREDQI